MKNKSFIALVLLCLLSLTVFSQNTSFVISAGYTVPFSTLLDNKNTNIIENAGTLDFYFKKRISKLNYLEFGVQYMRANMKFEHRDFSIDYLFFMNKHRIYTEYEIVRFPLLFQTKLYAFKNTSFNVSYGPCFEKIVNSKVLVYNRIDRVIHESKYLQRNADLGFLTPFLLKINISPLFKNFGISYSYLGEKITPIYKPKYGYNSIEMFIKSNFHTFSITYNINSIKRVEK